jgi:hypothetical protein
MLIFDGQVTPGAGPPDLCHTVAELGAAILDEAGLR